MTKPKLPAISRPNGKIYRPRKIQTVPFGNEEEVTHILVFGTHDIRFARLHASEAAKDIADEFYCRNFRLEIEGEAQKVWLAKALSHFEDGDPYYQFLTNETTGRAAVQFPVREIELANR